MKAKEMILMPDGTKEYAVIENYELNPITNRYEAQYKGRIIAFYDNFWA